VSYLNHNNILKEIVYFIRNSDVFSTTTRSVTTSTYTATLTGATTAQINVTNVKNLRSVAVGSTTLTYVDDYTYNTDYTGPSTLITFTTAQTGSLSVSYDYGTDKIFPDFPKAELKISNFPRIAVDFISINSEPGGFGNVMENKINFTVVVYASSVDDIRDYISTIRQKFGDAWISFKYLTGVIRTTSTGPLIVSENKHDKIFQQNIDFEARFNYEKN
jgi:hypothetical protein